jgi:hypothetical protein
LANRSAAATSNPPTDELAVASFGAEFSADAERSENKENTKINTFIYWTLSVER